MTQTVAVMLAAAVAYFLVVLVIGRRSARGSGTGKEAYFVGGRAMNGVVLFAAMFGTNMTAFVMLGLAGQTYRLGLATWSMLLGGVVVPLPVLFYFGYRCWLVARREGFTSPAEFYRERYGSEALGLVAFAFFVFWTLPVILTGIIGGGRVFETVTAGDIPYWLGALVITAVVAYYTTAGGMRGTAWTNLFQVGVFLGFLAVAVVWVPAVSGGPGALLDRLREASPQLVTRNWDAGAGWGPAVSFFVLFSSANFATPYIWIRMVSARSGRQLRSMALVYPIATLVTWGAAVLLSLWGAAILPGLEGPAADSVIFALGEELFPTWLVALGMLSLFAMVMSSMDAQALTISNLVTVDILERHVRNAGPAQTVRYARLSVLVLLAVLYVVALRDLPAVFTLSTFAFTGLLACSPMMIGGVLWRRGTRAGALASLLLGQAVAIAGYNGWFPFWFGLETPFWVALVSWGTFVVVSLATPPPPAETVERFHGVWDRVWARHTPAGREVVAPEPAPQPAVPREQGR